MNKQPIPRTHNPAWKDNTRNDRQKRRREREKEWLREHSYTSWEQIHTKLMNGEVILKNKKPAG